MLPTSKQIGREVLITLIGAVVAAAVIGQMPELRAWMRQQWGGAKP